MFKRTKTAVHFFNDGGFIVRGTQDPQAALALAVAEGEFEVHYDDAAYCRRDPDHDEAPSPWHLGELADLLHGLLAEARPGLYRMNPAGPDHIDGITWWCTSAATPGPGVFQGVMFQ